MKNRSMFSILIKILLCGIALHYMVVTIISKDNSMIKFWKEFIIILLFIDTVFLKVFKDTKENIKTTSRIDLSKVALFSFIINLVVISFVMTDKLYNAIFVSRLYLIPIIIYYIAKNNSRFNKDMVSKIIKFVLGFYSIVALWGIFQALILGDDFLIKLGYPLKYAGRLRDSYYFGGFGDLQRVVSTFSNTNVFAAVIGVIIIVVIFNPIFMQNYKYKKYCLVILVSAYILTFSRSNWLAMIVIIFLVNFKYVKMFVVNLKNKEMFKNIFSLNLKNKKRYKDIVIILLTCVLLSFVYQKISGISIYKIMSQYITKTIMLKDTSAAGRSRIWYDAFITFIHNPFGIGLGKVGMVAAKLSKKITVVAESSYFAILLDTGIQGFIFFFSSLIFNFYYTKKYTNNNIYSISYLKTVRYIMIYLMIIFLFSNHIYDLEIMIITSFFIGLGRNQRFLNSFIKDKDLVINKMEE